MIICFEECESTFKLVQRGQKGMRAMKNLTMFFCYTNIQVNTKANNMIKTEKTLLLPFYFVIAELLLLNINRAIERRFNKSSFVALFVMSKTIPVDHLTHSKET